MSSSIITSGSVSGRAVTGAFGARVSLTGAPFETTVAAPMRKLIG